MGSMAAAQTVASLSLPENTVAFSNCNAKVKVTAARLRSEPSLEASVIGVRTMDQSVFVTKVCGKWVQVALETGDTAYVAAYLLAFPYAELLEQWKRETPVKSVGKKARVKWAAVNFRRYPGVAADRLGRFRRGDEVAVLSHQGAWSLVEALGPDGKTSCYGFIADKALGDPEIPDPAEWMAPLARMHAIPGQAPPNESPADYLARTAWSPQVFAAEWQASHRHAAFQPGELLAVR
jgi:hypothetical protein